MKINLFRIFIGISSLYIFGCIGDLNAQGLKTTVPDNILKAYDYAYSGMSDQAKILLIESIHNPEFNVYESALRYALGSICFLNEDYQGAQFQWNTVLANDPNSNEAEQIKSLLNNILYFQLANFSDAEFRQEYSLSKLLWDPLEPNNIFDVSKLKNPALAMEYLIHLTNKYKEGNEKTYLLFDQFLLLIGYNTNDFGYINVKDNLQCSEISMEYFRKHANDLKATNCYTVYIKDFFLNASNIVADSLKMLPGGISYYVRAQYYIALALSGNKLQSLAIKINIKAKQYLENIVAATEGDQTNLFRIYAIMSLAELSKIPK